MADNSRQPYQPIKRRNFTSSSSSSSSSSTNYNSAKARNPNNPFTTSKPSLPNSNSSRNATKKTTTSNWENVDNSINDNDGNQDFTTLVGTCPFMCPVEERGRRERLRDLAVFERLHDNPSKTSPNLAVKKRTEFCKKFFGSHIALTSGSLYLTLMRK